jgi:UDP-N-acetylglucosamine 4,6-dehydratase
VTLADKVILVTGGSGSFGRAFIAEILLHHNPRKVIVYSRDEAKQAQMAAIMRDERLRFFVGDVRDIERLRMAMRGVNVVVHAAALKRIDSCEYNPSEAVETNVNGTLNVVRAALDCHVERMVSLSTDKASAPCTLYGATKLCAERLTLAANEYGGNTCAFSCTRYGNVAGSRGSVIPTWRAALAAGQRPRLYNTDATRYWMSQAEAVRLVLYALDNMQGGEVYIPKLRAFRVGDLAAAMGITDVEKMPAVANEKTHESLISPDEQEYGRDLGACYAIYRKPTGVWVTGGHTSDKAQRMGVEELRAALGAM